MNYLYFPTSAIASLIYTTAEGMAAEMGAMIIVSATAWWAVPHTRQFKD